MNTVCVCSNAFDIQQLSQASYLNSLNEKGDRMYVIWSLKSTHWGMLLGSPFNLSPHLQHEFNTLVAADSFSCLCG